MIVEYGNKKMEQLPLQQTKASLVSYQFWRTTDNHRKVKKAEFLLWENVR